MSEKAITRKFLKPLKGNGELCRLDQHVAHVHYFLQGWQDFPAGSSSEQVQSKVPFLSGMAGEITINLPERKKIQVEEMLHREFVLHTEKHADYEIQIYKVKDNNPSKGRYSVTCKLPEEIQR